MRKVMRGILSVLLWTSTRTAGFPGSYIICGLGILQAYYCFWFRCQKHVQLRAVSENMVDVTFSCIPLINAGESYAVIRNSQVTERSSQNMWESLSSRSTQVLVKPFTHPSHITENPARRTAPNGQTPVWGSSVLSHASLRLFCSFWATPEEAEALYARKEYRHKHLPPTRSSQGPGQQNNATMRLAPIQWILSHVLKSSFLGKGLAAIQRSVISRAKSGHSLVVPLAPGFGHCLQPHTRKPLRDPNACMCKNSFCISC